MLFSPFRNQSEDKANGDVVRVLEALCRSVSTDQPVRMQAFRDLSVAAKTCGAKEDGLVLKERVDNLVGLAVAAQLSAETSDPAAAVDASESNEQTFVVIQGEQDEAASAALT